MDITQEPLRRNIATWAVAAVQLPSVAHFLHDALPNEAWDPHFLGQDLETIYFDTRDFTLRRIRRQGDRYLTLRLRCYQAVQGGPEVYAMSGKTEAEKWRQEIDPGTAHAIQDNPGLIAGWLPPNLLARYQGLIGEEPLLGVVSVCCRRFAVEDDRERYTLDVGIHTDTGKRLPSAVLEYKSADPGSLTPAPLAAIGLRPLKLSKFLWATDWR